MISPAAKAAQDAARHQDGKFGPQVREDNDIDLGAQLRDRAEQIIGGSGWEYEADEFVSDTSFLDSDQRISDILTAFEVVHSDTDLPVTRGLTFDITYDVHCGYQDAVMSTYGEIEGVGLVTISEKHGIDGLTDDREAEGRDQAVATVSWMLARRDELLEKATKLGMR